MPEKEIRVFVYGTLKPGGHYWRRFCEGKVTHQVAAKIRGQLYDLPLGYPGLILDESTWATGYLLTLKNEEVLEGIDTLEGYEPDRPSEENEYDRVEINAYSPDGKSLGDAWTYIMRMERIKEHRGRKVTGDSWEKGP